VERRVRPLQLFRTASRRSGLRHLAHPVGGLAHHTRYIDVGQVECDVGRKPLIHRIVGTVFFDAPRLLVLQLLFQEYGILQQFLDVFQRLIGGFDAFDCTDCILQVIDFALEVLLESYHVGATFYNLGRDFASVFLDAIEGQRRFVGDYVEIFRNFFSGWKRTKNIRDCNRMAGIYSLFLTLAFKSGSETILIVQGEWFPQIKLFFSFR